MTEPSETDLPVPPELQRDSHASRALWLDSAVFAVDLLCRTLGRSDLAGVELLDVGCGTKVTKALLDQSFPIGHYVGVDVSPEVIEWLKANVSDDRFEYHNIDARNELYNPDGTPLDEFDALPVGDRRFDLICLFSVFTHLAPHDYVAMLRLLRHHVKDDGRLLYSLFLAESMSQSPKLLEAIAKRLGSDDPSEVEATRSSLVETHAAREGARYWEGVPANPLQQSVYTTDYALELLEGSGWEIVSVNPPQRPHIQDYIVAQPV